MTERTPVYDETVVARMTRALCIPILASFSAAFFSLGQFPFSLFRVNVIAIQIFFVLHIRPKQSRFNRTRRQVVYLPQYQPPSPFLTPWLIHRLAGEALSTGEWWHNGTFIKAGVFCFQMNSEHEIQKLLDAKKKLERKLKELDLKIEHVIFRLNEDQRCFARHCPLDEDIEQLQSGLERI